MEELTIKLESIIGDNIISEEDKMPAEILGDLLRSRKLTVATAESCTGGNIAHEITTVAGCSDYYKGSVVSYANSVKENQLGVSRGILESEGAVSEPVVRQMAEGVAALLQTDCAIATSGIAGPGGGTAEKPVGTVWMAAHARAAFCRQPPKSDKPRFDDCRNNAYRLAERQISGRKKYFGRKKQQNLHIIKKCTYFALCFEEYTY